MTLLLVNLLNKKQVVVNYRCHPTVVNYRCHPLVVNYRCHPLVNANSAVCIANSSHFRPVLTCNYQRQFQMK